MHHRLSVSTYDELIRLRTHKRHNDGHERVSPEEVMKKVIEDINFLRGRIDHIKRSAMAASNPTIIETYESMLQSRESVLAWLQEDMADLAQHYAHISRQHNTN